MVASNTCSCPHCGMDKVCRSNLLPAAALLLGLTAGLTACPGVGPQPDYGIAETGFETGTPVDADGDGFNASEDCDDQDASVNPDAEETPGDGVDSNCDGEDDT
jgi:hypothetical protein